MDDDVICISGEHHTRMVDPDPFIKHVVKENIGQQGTDDSMNAKGNFEFSRVIKNYRGSKKC